MRNNPDFNRMVFDILASQEKLSADLIKTYDATESVALMSQLYALLLQVLTPPVPDEKMRKNAFATLINTALNDTGKEYRFTLIDKPRKIH